MDAIDQRAMAERLCQSFDSLEFDIALKLVQLRPAQAQRMLDRQAARQQQQEESARRLKRLRQVRIEEFG